MFLIFFLLGSLIGAGIATYLIFQFKLKKKVVLDEHTANENKKIYQQNEILIEQLKDLENDYQKLSFEKNKISSVIEELKEQSQKASEALFEQSFNVANEKMSQAAEKLANEYHLQEIFLKEEYASLMKDAVEEFQKVMVDNTAKINEAKKTLAEFQEKAAAAIEAARREEEKLLELDKYKIIITPECLVEINRLREIAPYFKNPRPIYKIIWEGYYRNQFNEMISRIITSNNTTGIYKITNLKNQKTYIGQATDVNRRLKEHVKAGLGIDTPNNKLYTAMMSDGVENFTFEFLEPCESKDLNERESYWISFYKSQEHGYNMTKGNK